MKKKSNQGFTLIEMMIVTEIIAIIVAVSVPSLMRQRIKANESSAIQHLRLIATAEVTFNIAEGRFGTLEELCAGDMAIAHLSGEWSNGCVRSQYIYSYDAADIQNEVFRVTATPVAVGRSAIRTYWITESGEIGYSDPFTGEESGA